MKNIDLFIILLFSGFVEGWELRHLGVPGQQGIAARSGWYRASVSSPGMAEDYNRDKDNTEIYGPKTTMGWGPSFSLRGADGATGPAGVSGSKMLSGDNAPFSNLGETHDYWFDKIHSRMYSAKTGCGSDLSSGAIPPIPIN